MMSSDTKVLERWACMVYILFYDPMSIILPSTRLNWGNLTDNHIMYETTSPLPLPFYRWCFMSKILPVREEEEEDAKVGDDVFPVGDDAWKVTDEKLQIREAMFAIQLSRCCLLFFPIHGRISGWNKMGSWVCFEKTRNGNHLITG